MKDELDIVTAPESALGASLKAAGSQDAREFLRYFMASAVALVLDAGLLYVLTAAAVPYLYAGALAFICGLATIYLLSVFWVFEHRSTTSPLVEFMIFAVIGVVGLGLNEVLLYLLTGVLGWHVMLSKAASVIIVFSWNFIARKRMLFAHE